jgi:phosphoribosylanthranilate isomerase
MFIDKVTITGADNSIRPEELIPLSAEFPFVEWAILLSETKVDNPRFPSRSWIDELANLGKSHNLQLAGHVCGAWVRDLVTKKDARVFTNHPEYLEYFPRIQLNFSPYSASQGFLLELKPHKNQFILQMGSKYKDEKVALLNLGLSMGLSISMLFDRSGGKGVVPTSWPIPIEPFYCGYAGGLGPDSLNDQLPAISQTVGERTIWIDMESRVRSEDDQQFDLGKVRKCLELARPWVEPRIRLPK